MYTYKLVYTCTVDDRTIMRLTLIKGSSVSQAVNKYLKESIEDDIQIISVFKKGKENENHNRVFDWS